MQSNHLLLLSLMQIGNVRDRLIWISIWIERPITRKPPSLKTQMNRNKRRDISSIGWHYLSVDKHRTRSTQGDSILMVSFLCNAQSKRCHSFAFDEKTNQYSIEYRSFCQIKFASSIRSEILFSFYELFTRHLPNSIRLKKFSKDFRSSSSHLPNWLIYRTLSFRWHLW